MRHITDRSKTFVAIIAVLCVAPLAAHAQEDEGSLEEIVVTARKVEENLRDIPIAVTAFTEQSMEEQGISSLQDIADSTPGFDFASAFGRDDFRPVIRGQSNIIGRANAGLFVDGIIIEEGNASIPLAAMQRVEVVKGPQSALYGRNTLSGAVNYVLKTAGSENVREASLDLGQRGMARAEFHFSGPITDTIGAAVTVAHYERDGEYDNNYPGNPLGTAAYSDETGAQETTSLVGVLNIAATDRVNIQAHAMYETTDDGQYPIAVIPSTQNNCFITNPRRAAAMGVGPFVQPLPPAGTPESMAIGIRNRAGAAAAGYNGSGYWCGEVNVSEVLEAQGGGTQLETQFYSDSGTERDSLRLGFRIDAELTDIITFTSLTGYNDVSTTSALDQTFGRLDVRPRGSPAPFIPVRVGFITLDENEFDDFSQEFRLRFDRSENLNYTVGAYIYESDESGMDVGSSDPPGTALGDDGASSISSRSVFGAVEFRATNQLVLGAEARWNEDEFDIRPEGEDNSVSGSFDSFLPKLTARYEASDDAMVYFTVARGNKPGGLNSDAGLQEADRPVDEEEATSYELGLKALWMDNRLETNVAAYQIDWQDMQLTSTRAAVVNGQNLTFSILENVGEASIQGYELDITLRANDFWTARLGYAYIDSEIERFVQSVDAGAFAGSAVREAALLSGGYSSSGDVVISGVQLPQTSEEQVVFSNVFEGRLDAVWDWFLRADYHFNSGRFAQVYNLASTGDREIVNLRGGIRCDNIDIELWIDNALDNDTSPALIRYVDSAYGGPFIFGFDRAIGLTLPEKRRAGMTFRYRL
ncbi:MAG: TonB-dependent receptor [Gammaproteobacteria bacterium]|nr:TonB-dependent receptor [Gammaproteobacteria bacterium]